MEEDPAKAQSPDSPRPRRSRSAILRALALACAVITLGNAGWAAWDQDITYDEPSHLFWAQRLWEQGIDTRENFRYDSKTPALLPAVALRKALANAGVTSEQLLRFSTRTQSVVLLGLVLILVARLSRTENPDTQWVGLLLASLDANLAAHASIATTDVAYSAVVLCAALVIARSRGGFAGAVLMGGVLGLGLAVKFTVLLLVPAGLVFLIADRGAGLGARLTRVFVAAAVACLTASALYLFVGVATPLGAIPLETPSLRRAAAVAPSWSLPIPAAIMTGIDASLAHNQPGLWASYIFGADHPGGVWYYFVAHWLMKTPLALIPLILLGLYRARGGWRDRAILSSGALFALHLGYFSLLFSTQIGLRFALPCVALACVIAARSLGTVRSGALILVAVLSLAERLPYWGDPIAFTNLSVWPKSRAWWYTADSNLDYGQNRERVARFGKETGLALVTDQVVVTPGNFVVSANDLAIFERRRSYRWLVENQVPAVRIGFTHFAFAVTGDLFEEYMNAERRAPALPDPEGRCALPLQHRTPGARIAFEQNTSPEGARVWTVCVASRKGADIGFRVTEGRVWFGRITGEGRCEGDLLQEGQQAWFRAPRSEVVQLCLEEFPNRRRGLVAYRLAGYLTVRGQGAGLDVRAR